MKTFFLTLVCNLRESSFDHFIHWLADILSWVWSYSLYQMVICDFGWYETYLSWQVFEKVHYATKKTDQNLWATEIEKAHEENNKVVKTKYGGAISVLNKENGLSGQFLVNVLTTALNNAGLRIFEEAKTVTHPSASLRQWHI